MADFETHIADWHNILSGQANAKPHTQRYDNAGSDTATLMVRPEHGT